MWRAGTYINPLTLVCFLLGAKTDVDGGRGRSCFFTFLRKFSSGNRGGMDLSTKGGVGTDAHPWGWSVIPPTNKQAQR